MSDALTDFKKAKEEEYFRKKEQELIEQMRQRVALETGMQQLAEATGAADEEVLLTLYELGYRRETVELLYLVPLVQIAWANGFVTQGEREQIFEAARIRGIAEGSPAFAQLAHWLEKQPSEEFSRQTLHTISRLMQALPPEQQAASKRDLLSYCAQVAEVSGGILGFGSRISHAERAVIERVAAEVEKGRQAAVKQVLEAD
jgi:hypothetical protein